MKRQLITVMIIAVLCGLTVTAVAGDSASQVVFFQVRLAKETSTKPALQKTSGAAEVAPSDEPVPLKVTRTPYETGSANSVGILVESGIESMGIKEGFDKEGRITYTIPDLTKSAPLNLQARPAVFTVTGI